MGSHAAPSFYERLGVDRTASPKQIKAAYFSRINQLSYNADNADEREILGQAFQTLMDPALREQYDSTLRPRLTVVGDAPPEATQSAFVATRQRPTRSWEERLVVADEWPLWVAIWTVVVASGVIGTAVYALLSARNHNRPFLALHYPEYFVVTSLFAWFVIQWLLRATRRYTIASMTVVFVLTSFVPGLALLLAVITITLAFLGVIHFKQRS
jgi:hypothetical protein